MNLPRRSWKGRVNYKMRDVLNWAVQFNIKHPYISNDSLDYGHSDTDTYTNSCLFYDIIQHLKYIFFFFLYISI